MSHAFYWANNDGMGGHVWLSDDDLRALTDEMLVQGMPWPVARLPGEGEEDAVVAAADLEAVLAPADPVPKVLADHRLWRDWLVFLEGAAGNGGLILRR